MKLSKYDIADYLDSDAMVAAYLDLALESGDLPRVAAGLGNVARARGTLSVSNARTSGKARKRRY